MIAWWGRCCTKISKSLYCDWAAAQIKDKEGFEALSFLCRIWFTTIGGNNSVSVFDRQLFNPPSAVASGNDCKHTQTPPDKVRQHVVWMIQRGGVPKKQLLQTDIEKKKMARDTKKQLLNVLFIHTIFHPLTLSLIIVCFLQMPPLFSQILLSDGV